MPAGGAAAGPASTALAISGDSKWAAFLVYPSQAEARRARTARRPTYNKVALVNLVTGEKREFDKVRRFAFNGDRPTWLALGSYPADAGAAGGAGAVGAPGATPSGAPGGATPGGAGAAAAGRAEGTDLLLHSLVTGGMENIGNVGEFGFDDSGDWLAYTIDARDAVGNGLQLRHMKTGVVRVADSERALYRRLAWADSTAALAVLRGTVDTLARDTLFAVVSLTAIGPATPKKAVFDPTRRTDFPAGMRVASERAPRLGENSATVFFGIKEGKKATSPDSVAVVSPVRAASIVQPGAPGAGGTVNQPRLGAGDPEDETSTLVLWHWKDPRLQSMQIVQEQQDRAYTYQAAYRVAEDRFVRLADDTIRNVTVLPHDRYAYGTDNREYQQAASYSGRNFADLYTYDLRTGARTKVLSKHPSPFVIPAPDGRQVLYWGTDGHWYVLDVPTGSTRNITKDVPTNFADTEDDHNNLFPPSQQPFGWSKDASAVLLSDGWDAWKVPVRGGAAVNLTGDGRKTGVRYQRLYAFDAPPAAGAPGGGGGGRGGPGGVVGGFDLSRPLYFGTYGERTKKGGLARVAPGKAGATSLVWEDASFNFQKAREADVFLYMRQSARDFPNYYVAGSDLKSGRRITDANPEQAQYAWSSGVRIIDYVSDKGDSLQGALYLPADYQPGRKYPLLVTIYEKRSQLANTFVNPSETSAPNRSLYTSRGYAVLDPDIVYKVNDPGMSAVWSVLPAVKAVVATGIVDSANVGLWGHSWGGYQTAFLVTQTDMFKSAIAGAPLTDMVSMYSSIYWNTGGTNQAIFESSQGRFKGNFIQNHEAYIRNSPVFHADKVKTPLVILHNDKDGAVDFNQGITYYNTLRQLGKDVILLEYVGENHGLARPVNQKDYAIRMREWFDTYLTGAPAPDWMKEGVPRLKMDEHLKSRKDADKLDRTVKATVVP
ncbi:MAG: prolyl oligopeptidase family serine peptidase [Gemmatimonadaceae bacterium]